MRRSSFEDRLNFISPTTDTVHGHGAVSGGKGQLAVIFDGTNTEDFKVCFVARVLTYGDVGRKILIKLKDETITEMIIKTNGGVLEKIEEVEKESFPADKVEEAVLANIFDDVTGSISATILNHIKGNGNDEQSKEFFKLAWSSDVKGLLEKIKTIGEKYQSGIEERSRRLKNNSSMPSYIKNATLRCFAAKPRRSKPSMKSTHSDNPLLNSEEEKDLPMPEYYSVIDGIKSMFSGDYVQHSWRQNDDGGDLQGDIVGLQTSLALVGALILTFAFPMFTVITSVDDTYTFVYSFCVAVCIVMESVCVLLAVRNIIVVLLVRAENMTKFVGFAGDALILPVRVNFIAVLAMVAALIFFGLSLMGEYPVIGFSVVIILPAVYTLVYNIGKGIQALWVVQPWQKELEDVVSLTAS